MAAPMHDPDRPRARPLLPRTPRPERQVAFRTGISAESRAAAFLIAKGFRILARRYRTPVGEIDIVARRRKLLVFVEVKARERFDDAACRSPIGNGRTLSQPPTRGLPPIPTMP
jgi:hypothetical protein